MIVRTIAAVREAIAAARARGQVIGFVPTMGYLHEGHLSLVDRARAAGAGFIVVSIFVNPTQFGVNEDFDKYPREETRDAALLADRGVDLLFLPAVEEMYPPGSQTRVAPGAVAEPLEGERRPGHFSGVATIVLKLFNITQPDLAVFGRKDAQQCAVVAQMVRDLDVPVRLVVADTIREHDGLAMSSRNAYLSQDDRVAAVALSRALRSGEAAVRDGSRSPHAIDAAMSRTLSDFPAVELDYLRVVDPETFLTPSDLDRDLLLVGAVRVGRTRLIDNIQITRAATPASRGAQE